MYSVVVYIVHGMKSTVFGMSRELFVMVDQTYDSVWNYNWCTMLIRAVFTTCHVAQSVIGHTSLVATKWLQDN
jgi:hypothetical protein